MTLDVTSLNSSWGKCAWLGWQAETDNENDDDRVDVHYLTIVDEEGEELAVIVHRTVGGKYPLDGWLAKHKEARAQFIVNALNTATVVQEQP